MTGVPFVAVEDDDRALGELLETRRADLREYRRSRTGAQAAIG
ncbi:MAG TPA: hypothetical protein VGZ22_20040 [Isosphaeraceae bacterium]|jgi:hypothetical protein|nr:hypothetical protein [Isosphaeraceae bacterium]